ncbi:MAG: hypothetical protein QOE70_4398 [Chthoniobacter sp.]|jgi:hypothetical protein|nr:hypothetical protein [Chthoniobacter sp.]
MAESPEIPEAKDPFERRVALTIAIIAIFLSFVANLGDNAKTDAIIKTNEASNQWGYFQAKGIKEQMSAMHADLVGRMSGAITAGANSTEVERLRTEVARYEGEKGEIKAKAELLQVEATHQSSINDRCDQSALLLQIAVVICSVSILAQSHKFWWAGMVLGAAGIAVGATAFFL